MEFPSLDTPIDALPIQEARTQVEDDIARSLSILSRLRYRMNLLADISRHFPEEIIAEIFIQYRSFFFGHDMDTIPTSSLGYFEFIRITHVSRLWRDIALRCARLWSSILVPNNLEFTAELLRRSKEAALNVDARSVTEKRIPSLKLVLKESRRIRSLSIQTFPRWHSQVIADLFDGSAPVLEDLAITVDAAFGVGQVVSPPAPEFKVSSPRLHTLALQNVGLYKAVPYMSKSLKTLSLNGQGQRMGRNTYVGYRELFLKALAGMPYLEKMDLCQFLPAAAGILPSCNSVHLPRLESLKHFDSPANVTWLLGCLQIPEACILTLDCIVTPEPIPQFSPLATEISVKFSGDQSTLVDFSVARQPNSDRLVLYGWSHLHPISPEHRAPPHLHLGLSMFSQNAEILPILFQGLPLHHLRTLYVGDIHMKDSLSSLPQLSSLKVLFLRGWNAIDVAKLLLQNTISESAIFSDVEWDLKTITAPTEVKYPSLDLIVLSKTQFDDYVGDLIENISVLSQVLDALDDDNIPGRSAFMLLVALKARKQWNTGIRQLDLKESQGLSPASVQHLSSAITCAWDGL